MVCTLTIFSMVSPVIASSPNEIDPPEPVIGKKSDSISLTGKVDNGNNETPGEWYIGNTPTNPVPNAPVLLFVPGLNNVAQIFWENNDMYQTAVDAGYQTAFIQLYDAGGASADMWNNGALLADKIQEISNHFNKPITVIAYSKGGVDTQTALTYYGAATYVDNVITLSSPHHGSQLADLAYSSWSSWLADLIGAKGDGTYAMQTGYMANFRSNIDTQPLAYYNDYYTLGGTAWGSAFSSTWYGGMYLRQYGQNDGVVTTASSRLPGGSEVAIGDWTHTTIRTGVTFPVFANQLSGDQLTGHPNSSRGKNDSTHATTNRWLHGGPLKEHDTETIPLVIENDVASVDVHLMTSGDISEVRLIDPSGRTLSPTIQSTQNEEGVFAGSTNHALTIDKPMSGQWEINITNKNNGAYLLTADYDSRSLIARNESIDYSHGMTYQLEMESSQVEEQSLTATYRVTDTKDPRNSKTYTVKGTADLSKSLTFSNTNTVYNITIDIDGKTQSGHPFKRTIIESVMIGR